MNLKEETVKSNLIFKGKIISLKNDDIKLPDGRPAQREYVCHPGGVTVLPITDKGEVLLVRQFRYPYGEEVLEIPAGKRDSADEEPLACGRRELYEELGVTAQYFRFLGEFYPTPGYVDEVIYMYVAWGLTFGENHPDDDEFLEKEKIHIDRLCEMIMQGEIKDGKTQAAALKVKNLIDKGEIE